MQDTRTGEGTADEEETSRNDDTGSNPLGNSLSDKSGRNFNGKRPRGKNRRKTLNFGTLNVRTLITDGKFELLINEIKFHNINVTGIAETRWSGNGHFEHDGHYIVYSGADKSGYGGVALILDSITKKSLLSEDYINERIVMIKLDTKPTKTTIIQVFAPTSKKEADDDVDQFYEDLQAVLSTIKDKDPIIIMGDFNAKVGQGQLKDSGLGPYGLGQRNERGERLLSFCKINNFAITNTHFQQHKRRRYTWVSPKQERHQLDYILVNKGWMSSVLNSKSRPGADHNTDHILVQAKIRMKTFKCQSKKIVVKHDIERLEDDEIRLQYNVSTENKFELLLQSAGDDQQPEELLKSIKDIYISSAEEILGKKKRNKTKPWISKETIELTIKKREARVSNSRTEYVKLKAEIQKKIRADKRSWLENQCKLIDEFDRKHQSKKFFKQIKVAKNSNIKSEHLPINDKDNKTLTDKDEIMERWKEYGQSLFCLPDGETQATSPPDSPPENDVPPEPPPLLSEVGIRHQAPQ